MLEGKRVTHKYFTPEEWVSMEDGMIVTEDGYNFDPDEFWNVADSVLFLTKIGKSLKSNTMNFYEAFEKYIKGKR